MTWILERGKPSPDFKGLIDELTDTNSNKDRDYRW